MAAKSAKENRGNKRNKVGPKLSKYKGEAISNFFRRPFYAKCRRRRCIVNANAPQGKVGNKNSVEMLARLEELAEIDFEAIFNRRRKWNSMRKKCETAEPIQNQNEENKVEIFQHP